MIPYLSALLVASACVLVVVVSYPFLRRFGEWWDGKIDDWFDGMDRRKGGKR